MEEKKYENFEPNDIFSQFRGSSIFPQNKTSEELLCDVLRDKMIEDIAFNLFQDKMQITFKRDLTPDEKKSITDNESFKYFLEEAEKYYEKRMRSTRKKKYPEKIIPASGVRNWARGAYCICFVYSKYDGNFVLKGYVKEVEEYLKKNHTHYFYNLSMWSKGFNRDIWHFWKSNVGIFRPSIRERRKGTKIEVRHYSFEVNEDEKISYEFKRLPKRWIPEFDNF